MNRKTPPPPPILDARDFDADPVFQPENLLREARRQKRIPAGSVPEICVLDPDGDMVRHLCANGLARPSPHWACYHTELYEFDYGGLDFGIVGCAVGAPFAVLVAEEMFACGCRLVISMTSAGQLAKRGEPPYFVLIDRALRDEGTSYHYLPPSQFSTADGALLALIEPALAGLDAEVLRGGAWTTDAPFRETASEVARHAANGLLAVEMEAAALYAFARAGSRQVICFAHVTNQMALGDIDFEKGEAGGAPQSLAVIAAAAQSWADAAGEVDST